MENIDTKQKGDSLEMAVQHIFNVANFKTERNVFIAKYEIDVKVTVGDRTIIVECKNYQNSNLTIRNLIHQWNSKNEIIKAHKIIIVLAGLKIKDSDYQLANELDIELWDQESLTDLFNLSLKPDELRLRLLEKISFKPITIAERYRDNITSLVIKPLLSAFDVSTEGLYNYFNQWLRAHILTELQFRSTTKEERLNHIELFEKNKTKKGFLNISKKRTQKDYWDTVLHQLATLDVLPSETQNQYVTHMNNLMAEYETQKQFFQGDDFLEKTRKLIQSRIQNAVIFNQDCKFYIQNMQNFVQVSMIDNQSFIVHISDFNQNDANTMSWVVTSQYKIERDENNTVENFYWIFSSFTETVDMVFRIFTEFYNMKETDQLKDSALKIIS